MILKNVLFPNICHVIPLPFFFAYFHSRLLSNHGFVYYLSSCRFTYINTFITFLLASIHFPARLLYSNYLYRYPLSSVFEFNFIYLPPYLFITHSRSFSLLHAHIHIPSLCAKSPLVHRDQPTNHPFNRHNTTHHRSGGKELEARSRGQGQLDHHRHEGAHETARARETRDFRANPVSTQPAAHATCCRMMFAACAARLLLLFNVTQSGGAKAAKEPQGPAIMKSGNRAGGLQHLNGGDFRYRCGVELVNLIVASTGWNMNEIAGRMLVTSRYFNQTN